MLQIIINSIEFRSVDLGMQERENIMDILYKSQQKFQFIILLFWLTGFCYSSLIFFYVYKAWVRVFVSKQRKINHQLNKSSSGPTVGIRLVIDPSPHLSAGQAALDVAPACPSAIDGFVPVPGLLHVGQIAHVGHVFAHMVFGCLGGLSEFLYAELVCCLFGGQSFPFHWLRCSEIAACPAIIESSISHSIGRIPRKFIVRPCQFLIVNHAEQRKFLRAQSIPILSIALSAAHIGSPIVALNWPLLHLPSHSLPGHGFGHLLFFQGCLLQVRAEGSSEGHGQIALAEEIRRWRDGRLGEREQSEKKQCYILHLIDYFFKPVLITKYILLEIRRQFTSN